MLKNTFPDRWLERLDIGEAAQRVVWSHNLGSETISNGILTSQTRHNRRNPDRDRSGDSIQ